LNKKIPLEGIEPESGGKTRVNEENGVSFWC